jgi:hypothetical protein
LADRLSLSPGTVAEGQAAHAQVDRHPEGHAFAPDDTLKKALLEATLEGREWLDAQYERFFDSPFFLQAHWALPASTELVQVASNGYTEADSYPVDSRGGAYYWAFSAIKHGCGPVLPDDHTRRRRPAARRRAELPATVPPNPPVSLYWSATAYDRQTHALILAAPHVRSELA